MVHRNRYPGVVRGGSAPQGYNIKQICSIYALNNFNILLLHALCIRNALEYVISRRKKLIFF